MAPAESRPLPEELHGLYDVESETPRFWTLRCRKCERRYSLPKPSLGSDVGVGWLQPLRQHALSPHEG